MAWKRLQFRVEILTYFNKRTPRRHSSLQQTSLASFLVIIVYFVGHIIKLSTPALVAYFRNEFLVCMWRYGGHVGWQEQELVSPMESKLNFIIMQIMRKEIVLYCHRTWPPCHVAENQEFMITVETVSICRLFMWNGCPVVSCFVWLWNCSRVSKLLRFSLNF